MCKKIFCKYSDLSACCADIDTKSFKEHRVADRKIYTKACHVLVGCIGDEGTALVWRLGREGRAGRSGR